MKRNSRGAAHFLVENTASCLSFCRKYEKWKYTSKAAMTVHRVHCTHAHNCRNQWTIGFLFSLCSSLLFLSAFSFVSLFFFHAISQVGVKFWMFVRLLTRSLRLHQCERWLVFVFISTFYWECVTSCVGLHNAFNAYSSLEQYSLNMNPEPSVRPFAPCILSTYKYFFTLLWTVPKLRFSFSWLIYSYHVVNDFRLTIA